ncbi:Eukaryotic translation initiation factor 3 subunit [Trichinella spiralis]|uniref:Eukaryotic translation initiation factor 3 subunit K n=1 Tax=Trichinella spiralis TaxID=6334 RepID=A0ABR3K8U4_TRISP
MEKYRQQFLERCDGVNRYNPDNVEFLEKYVREQCDKQGVDMEANLTLLKLYQLNPNLYNERIVCRIFLKCVMALPSADMVLAKCLLDEYRMESECLKTICDISALLETCRFKEAWQLIRKEADLVDLAIGFEEHVRHFVAHVVSITYQNIDTQLLQQLLGDVNDSDFENLCKQYNWTRKVDGSTFISNHEATIKSRNIEEKIEFNDMMSFIRDLSNTPECFHEARSRNCKVQHPEYFPHQSHFHRIQRDSDFEFLNARIPRSTPCRNNAIFLTCTNYIMRCCTFCIQYSA